MAVSVWFACPGDHQLDRGLGGSQKVPLVKRCCSVSVPNLQAARRNSEKLSRWRSGSQAQSWSIGNTETRSPTNSKWQEQYTHQVELEESSWTEDSSSCSELLQKIIQVHDVCADALKYDELSRSQVEQLTFTMIDSYKILLEKEETANPVHISTVLHRCASFARMVHLELKVLRKRWDFLSHLLKVLQKQVDSLKPRTLATVVWSLGCFGPNIKEKALGGGLIVADLLHQIAIACEIAAPQFHPVQYSATLVGLANLEHRSERWVSALCLELDFKVISCKPREMANIAWAIGKLECHDSCTTIELMARKSQHCFHLFTPQGVSNMVWGGARVRATFPAAFLDGLVGHVLHNLSEMKPQDLSNILWSLSKLKFYPGELFLSKIASVATNMIGSFKGQEVANLLYAYAVFGEAPAEMLNVASKYIIRNQSRFKLQELINCGWALAILGGLSGQQFDIMVARIMRDSSIGLGGPSSMGIRMSPNISDNDLNQLYQCLLHLKYICPEEEFSIPGDLEKACHHSWVDWELHKSTSHTIPKIVDVLESMNFPCKTPKFLPSIGIIINEIMIGDQIASVEVVRPSSCFENFPTKCQGPIVWWHQLLHHLQIEPLVVHENVWITVSKSDQASFLEDNILVVRDRGLL